MSDQEALQEMTSTLALGESRNGTEHRKTAPEYDFSLMKEIENQHVLLIDDVFGQFFKVAEYNVCSIAAVCG